MSLPERCPAHLDAPSRHACAACFDAYELARDARIERDHIERRERFELARQLSLAAAACGLCDEHGRLPDGLPCHHNPDQAETLRRGLDLCREALLCHV